MDMKTEILAEGLRFPESPRWYEGALWFSDFFSQQVMRAELNGRVETVLELPDTPSGLGWTPEGHLLVVSANARRLLRVEDGDFVEVADLSGLADSPYNDMVIDGQGRAYIGSMGFDFSDPHSPPRTAPIVLVTPDGQAQIAAEGLAFPNGMVITPDGRTLIVGESYGGRLTAFTIETGGTLSNRRTWAQFDEWGEFEMPADRINPDGMGLDAEEAVWVASPNTREVIRVREGGQITHRLGTGAIPLACTLGGDDRCTLFILTTESLDFSDTQAQGRIEIVPVETPGAGLP